MSKRLRRSKRRSSRSRGEYGVPARRTTVASEAPLVVFISSVMHCMEEERQAADRAIRSITFSRPWRFESAPASSQCLEESYLSKVRMCDIFVLIIGEQYSEPVKNEYHVAVEMGKPVLAFVRAAQRSPEQEAFLSTMGSKYDVYESPADLHHKVRVAVTDEVARRYRNAIRPSDVRSFLIPESSPNLQNPNDVVGYTIFGVEESPLSKTLEAFGGRVMPDSEVVEADFAVTQIFFANLDEAGEVFGALHRAVEQMERNPKHRQQVFLRALGQEAARRIGEYAASKVSKQEPARVPDESGLRYLIIAVRDAYAPLIRILQAPEIMGGQPAVDPSATRILVKDVNAIIAWAEAWQGARGTTDTTLLVQTFVEAAARYWFQKTVLNGSAA